MSGWVIGTLTNERRFHDFEALLATGVSACAVRDLPSGTMPIAQSTSSREVLWSDGFVQVDAPPIAGLTELHHDWLYVLGDLRSDRQHPQADLHSRQKLLTLLTEPCAYPEPYTISHTDWHGYEAEELLICPDIPLTLLLIVGARRSAYYFSDELPSPETLRWQLDTTLIRLTHTCTMLEPSQEYVLELPPNTTLKDAARELKYLQMAQSDEALAFDWGLFEPRENEFAQVLILEHPEYRLHPPGTPTHGFLDFLQNWEALRVDETKLNEHVTPRQRTALLNIHIENADIDQGQWLKGERTKQLARLRIAELERDPGSKPLVYEKRDLKACSKCGEVEPLNQLGLCMDCTHKRLLGEAGG